MLMNPGQLFVSVDIESDGPIPGHNSMLSFGAAAFEIGSTTPLATFEANLDPLPGAVQDPKTMAFWAMNPEAWKYVTSKTRKPSEVMPLFVSWVKALGNRPVMVGYPVTFDFMFLHWYILRYGGVSESPLGFQGLDIKTLVAERLGIPFSSVSKRVMPKEWFEGAPKHNHTALQDAVGQGVMFVNMNRQPWKDMR